MASPKQPPGRLVRLLGGLAVAAMVLGLMEGMLRLLLGPPPPPVEVYSGLGPRDQYFSLEDGMVTADYQSRDPFPAWPAVVSTPRAAAIGGSSLHERSAKVLGPRQFPALVGERSGIETLNLGSPALDSHDLVRIVEELMAFPPDALIVYTGHNDFGNTYFSQRYGDLSSGLTARAQASLERLQLFCQLRRSIAPSAQTATSGPAHRNEPEPLTSTQRWAALRYLEGNLRRIIWMGQKADMPVILVTPVSALNRPPTRSSCVDGRVCSWQLWMTARETLETDPEEAERLLRKARDHDTIPMRAPSFAVDAVRALAEDEGVWLVDAERSLPRDPVLDTPADDLFHDHVHFSAAGHAAMAEVIAPVLQEALGSSIVTP